MNVGHRNIDAVRFPVVGSPAAEESPNVADGPSCVGDMAAPGVTDSGISLRETTQVTLQDSSGNERSTSNHPSVHSVAKNRGMKFPSNSSRLPTF